MTADILPAVLADLRSGQHLGVVVDSPPGAGKSTLVVRAAVAIASAGDPLIVIAQTNEQVDDLVVRLATEVPDLAIGRLSARDYQPVRRLARHPNVTVAAQIADMPASRVVVGTAAKWATVTERRWPWAIVDEAYQMQWHTDRQIVGPAPHPPPIDELLSAGGRCHAASTAPSSRVHLRSVDTACTAGDRRLRPRRRVAPGRHS